VWKEGFKMNKILVTFMVLALTAFFYTPVAMAKSEVKDGVEYWTTSESDVAPLQVVEWMASQPVSFVGTGTEKGLFSTGKTFEVYDVEPPVNNLNVANVRVLVYTSDVKDGPITLMGYTVIYENNDMLSFRYNKDKDKYMTFDYGNRRFAHMGRSDRFLMPHNGILPDRSAPSVFNRGWCYGGYYNR